MGNNYFWAQDRFYNQTKGTAMGARYAPSVANVVLNKWEGETIYKENNQALLYYKRYIDCHPVVGRLSDIIGVISTTFE